MDRYVEFGTETGDAILIEVDASEVTPGPGVEKAGLLDRGEERAVARAQESFETAISSAVRRSVAALSEAIGSLPRAPEEIELTFGIKATGEIGNIAIAKAGGEANFTVRLAWKA
jgi:hypothetical protein